MRQEKKVLAAFSWEAQWTASFAECDSYVRAAKAAAISCETEYYWRTVKAGPRYTH